MTRAWFVVAALSLVLACLGGDVRLFGFAGLVLAASALALKVCGVLRRRAARRTLEGLRGMHPGDFEAEVGRWLRRDGWQTEHRGGTGDGGIDIVARRRGQTLAIQCKRYAESAAVSASHARDLYGAAVATGASCAVLVTTGRISGPALAWAASLPSGPELRFHDMHCLPRLARGNVRV